jgi:deoxyribodipyrimidine photo-lyase
MSDTPVIWWIRRDLRLADNAALMSACVSGHPVIPVFVLDPLDEGLGAASKWRLAAGLMALADALKKFGSRLIFRRGRALDVIPALCAETGASAVVWSRLYDPETVTRDKQIKSALKDTGIAAKSHPGRVLFEPWDVQTKTGGFYRVFTPFWKSVRSRSLARLSDAPSQLPRPEHWPVSDDLNSWNLAAAVNRGADVLSRYARVGEAAAQSRLEEFLENGVDDYPRLRDVPGVDGTSGLSEPLAWGEISPHRCWHLGWRALQDGHSGAETFLKELVWREFAYHLMWHTPHILTRNWRPQWDDFPWQTEVDKSVRAWQQGRTGNDFVDAAMRELYVTGRMHNRGRMIVASYLTKHLLVHWRVGQTWFADCLTDWDPASNAMGWQWAAGSGPDAAPYFRVFNPDGQLDRFDRDRTYVRRWIAEGQGNPPETSLDYFRAIPRSSSMSPSDLRPDPVVNLADGRNRALESYKIHIKS